VVLLFFRGLGGLAFGFWLRFGVVRHHNWRHRRVPVDVAGATIADEQFALAELVPHLRTDSHAAADALLVVNARYAGAARAAEAVEASKYIGLDEGADGFALESQLGQFAVKFGLMARDPGAGVTKSNREGLDLGASGSQRGLLCFSAFEADNSFGLKPFDLGFGKVKLVFRGVGLLGGGERILLGAEPCGLFTGGGNLEIQPCAEGFFGAERRGDLGGLTLGGCQCGLGFGDLRRQGARSQSHASALQFNCLQLYEVFNQLLHRCIEVYAIERLFSKWRIEDLCKGEQSSSVLRGYCFATIKANREAGVTEARRSLWRGRRWVKWVAGGLLVVLAGAAVVVELALRRAEPYLRARIVEELTDRFHSRVELDSFHVSLVNGLWAEGKGLRIWPPSRVEGVGIPAGEGEPLIRLDEFRFHAPLRYAPGKPITVSMIELKGLKIDMPPKSHFQHAADAGSSEATTKPKSAMARLVSFQVETMKCTGTELVMETSKPGKLPMVFQIAHLSLTGIASQKAMGYDAELTNPRPHGAIHSKGSFGPWQTDDPGETPVLGDYTFDHADLGDFKEIAGILSSTGHFEGTLRNLTVDGQTETPDFRLTHFGNAMNLTTRFHARVDGTNGDTWLEPVDAVLGHSHFTAAGQIVRVRGDVVGGAQQYIGHDIALTVNVDKARIEDFMRLASNSNKVLLTGDVTVKTKLHIPPGKIHVHERLSLDGSFSLSNALFTSDKIQGRIAELSMRGQGRPDERKTVDPASIRSQMQSSFTLKNGVITLPALEYTVPGAKIELSGTYKLDGGSVDFTGAAKMDAPVSEVVGGWKGLLLMPANRYFKKDDAGTAVPIHIEGTRDALKFGIDFGRVKTEEKPAEQQP